MKKILKNVKITFLILLIILISGCKTIEYVYPDYKNQLPVKPDKVNNLTEIFELYDLLDAEKELELFEKIILYYDNKLTDWNNWYIDVLKILDNSSNDK